MLVRQASREVMKLIPYVGSVAGGVLGGASTFALGKAFCYYFSSVHKGHVPKPEECAATTRKDSPGPSEPGRGHGLTSEKRWNRNRHESLAHRYSDSPHRRPVRAPRMLRGIRAVGARLSFLAWWPLAGCLALAYLLGWYWQRQRRLLPPPEFSPRCTGPTATGRPGNSLKRGRSRLPRSIRLCLPMHQSI